MNLSKILEEFPKFKKWVKNKKLSDQDLNILTEFEPNSLLKPLLKWIEDQRPSHSQGKQILNLGGELLLMNKDIKTLLSKEHQAPELIQSLKQKRNHNTFKRDQNKSGLIDNLNWPSSIKAKWIRQNDRGALSIHFQSFSLRDFKQKIQKLNSVYKQMSEQDIKIFKN